MRNRRGAVSGIHNFHSRRSRRTSWLSLLVFLLAGSLGFVWWTGVNRAANDAPPVNLVRLVLTASEGTARIEVVADGALSETAIERFTRAGETVIRIRGARSLLRPTYAASDIVARNVRTYRGETNGEPFVDIVINVTVGDALVQRKNFNRFVIGITNQIARQRFQSQQTPPIETQARVDSSGTGVVSIDSAPVTDSIPSSGSRVATATTRSANSYGTSYAPTSATPATQSTQTVNTNVSGETLVALPLPARAPALFPEGPTISTTARVNPPTFTFRGRTLWLNNFGPGMPVRLGNLRGVPSTFWQGQTYAPADMAGSWSFVPLIMDAPGQAQGRWIPGTSVALRDEIGGHAFGPGLLRPSVELGGVFDDNFFYRSATGRNLGIFTLAPRLEYEIPGDTSGLRMMYEARLRRLTNGEWANGQTFDFDVRTNLGSYVRLAFRDHFTRSALDPREYDPAGEVYIVGDTFWRNDGALRVDFLLSPRSRLGAGAGYNLVRWDEDHINGAPLFIDYDELYTDLTYERDVSESTTALVTASFANTNSTDPLRPQFEGLSDHYRYQFQVGARTQITETNGVAFRVGYERTDFRFAPTQNDYNTMIFDLLYRRDLSERINFQLAALRKTQVSTFNLEGGNARLLSTGARARIEGRATEALKLGLGVNYQQLGFPLAVVFDTTASGGVALGAFAGERRKDHLYGFSFDAAYQWTELVRSRFVYSFTRRDSTLPVLTYNRNRLSLVIEFGRRNNARGRPF